MKLKLFNWSNALEILEHEGSGDLLYHVMEIVKNAPHFSFDGKSESTTASGRIDTCQEHLNCYFDYQLYQKGWDIQPLIGIGNNNEDKETIRLKADFRKTINNRFFKSKFNVGIIRGSMLT